MKFLPPLALRFLWLALVALPALAAPANRPNIIFLLTDDQRDNTLGAMGHPWVKTPHLDRLMHESVRFRQTYIASPVCAPSRVSFFTGMLERVHGVGFSSSYVLTEAQWERSYPALLRRSGYHTGFIGKFGVEYYTFKGRAAEKFDYWWAHDGWTKFLPKGVDSPSTKPYHRAKEDIITYIMGEAMSEFLDRRPGDRPFCLSVSFNVPHGSQVTSMYPDYPEWHQMTRPANENPKLKGHPFYDSLYRDFPVPIPAETGTDPTASSRNLSSIRTRAAAIRPIRTTTPSRPTASTTSATTRRSPDSTTSSASSAPIWRAAASPRTPSSSSAATTV